MSLKHNSLKLLLRERTTGGLLCFIDGEKLKLVSRLGISSTYSVVQCAWHPKLSQIFAITGDKSKKEVLGLENDHFKPEKTK